MTTLEKAKKCLDAVMRKVSKKGLGSSSRKRTEPISQEEEDKLWDVGALGEDSPEQLLDTILYLTGLHFALRGVKEHGNLRLFVSPQVTGPHIDHNGRKYLLYTEGVSKTNQGGLQDRKGIPKEVRAYENVDDPSRCYVRLFANYKSLCAEGKDTDYFYFAPMKNP